MDPCPPFDRPDRRFSDSAPVGVFVRVSLLTGLVAGLAILVFGIAIFAGASALYSSIYDAPCSVSECFEQYSGLIFPTNSTIVHSAYVRNGFNGDGEYVCIFDLSSEQVESLVGTPCWGSSWRAGLPEPKANRFFDERFRNDPVWTDTSVLYVVEDRGPADFPWHNARIIIVSPETGRVWFGEYDF